VMDISTLRGHRKPKRTVLYLSDAELNKFVDSIPLRTWTGKPRISGYRFRALLETLSATAMRISEALSLNRDTIDFARAQATIIGKGNKQRTVFFTSRALEWITRYLDIRQDAVAPLFATDDGR